MANTDYKYTYRKIYMLQPVITIDLADLTRYAQSLPEEEIGYSLDEDPIEAYEGILSLLGEAHQALDYFDIKQSGHSIHYPAYLDLGLASKVVQEADIILDEQGQLTNEELDPYQFIKTAGQYIADGDPDSGYAQMMGLDYYRKLLSGYVGGDDTVYDYHNSYVITILELLQHYVGHAVLQ